MDLFDKENTVRTFPQRNCLACGELYSPETNWSERCPDCKASNKPKFKKIINKHFNGKNPLPLEKLRIKLINGIKMPSVTTVLHPHGIDYPAELLEQYAARGTLVHKQIEVFLLEGIWREDPNHLRSHLKDKEEKEKIKQALKILENGKLGLSTKQCSFPNFYEKYRALFTFNNLEQAVQNTTHNYCGTFDCHGTYKGKPAIIDFKTASDYNTEKLNSYFQQLSAYANADGIEKIKYLVVIPLNPKSSVGFDPPLVTTKVKSFFREFLKKREVFKSLYGI